MLTAALSAPSCVRFENFPTINAPSNDPALYRVKNKDWKAYTERARTDVRGAHFDWLLVGDSGEVLARPEEVRAAFSGVIFVGDSQIREVAWAALGLLASGSPVEWNMSDPVFSRSNIAKRRPTVIPGAQASQATAPPPSLARWRLSEGRREASKQVLIQACPRETRMPGVSFSKNAKRICW